MEHKYDDNDEETYWLVKWQDYDDSFNTWEPFEILNEVEAFQQYCRKYPSLKQFLPNTKKGKKRRLQDKDA